MRIGGIDATVEYAGAAPGLVSGVLQVNAHVPESLAREKQPVQITVGDAAYQMQGGSGVDRFRKIRHYREGRC